MNIFKLKRYAKWSNSQKNTNQTLAEVSGYMETPVQEKHMKSEEEKKAFILNNKTNDGMAMTEKKLYSSMI